MRAKRTAIANALLLGITWAAAVPAANHMVTANENMRFTPSSLTIVAGDTVTFQNGGGLHNVMSDPGSITMFRCANGCDGAGGNGAVSGAA
jgi:plastocyanin